MERETQAEIDGEGERVRGRKRGGGRDGGRKEQTNRQIDGYRHRTLEG